MNKRILLADDSLTIQKVVELTFMDESFDVEAVGSGDEAIESLGGSLPDILIADVHMPGPSGYEVCRRAKALKEDLPVLLLVGTFEALDDEEMAACGAEGHLKKPFDSQELLQVVQRLTSATAAPSAGFDLGAAQEPEVEIDVEVDEFDLGESIDLGGADEVEEAAPEEAGPEEPSTGIFGLQGSGHDDREAVVAPAPVEEEEAPWVGRSIELAEERSDPPAAEESSTPAPRDASTDRLSDDEVERVARRVVELLADETVREVAWDVIPDLAEIVIKDRIRELEAD